MLRSSWFLLLSWELMCEMGNTKVGEIGYACNG